MYSIWFISAGMWGYATLCLRVTLSGVCEAPAAIDNIIGGIRIIMQDFRRGHIYLPC